VVVGLSETYSKPTSPASVPSNSLGRGAKGKALDISLTFPSFSGGGSPPHKSLYNRLVADDDARCGDDDDNDNINGGDDTKAAAVVVQALSSAKSRGTNRIARRIIILVFLSLALYGNRKRRGATCNGDAYLYRVGGQKGTMTR
jgi:hypothetical protein